MSVSSLPTGVHLPSAALEADRHCPRLPAVLRRPVRPSRRGCRAAGSRARAATAAVPGAPCSRPRSCKRAVPNRQVPPTAFFGGRGAPPPPTASSSPPSTSPIRGCSELPSRSREIAHSPRDRPPPERSPTPRKISHVTLYEGWSVCFPAKRLGEPMATIYGGLANYEAGNMYKKKVCAMALNLRRG